ncbi:chymotrypsinogen A-like [Anopheles albimanus]|uniref:chymotrypsinogen A-like n=1 Tax=Anopheles albimanus TaxID=7167 RepID=UPI00163E4F97|nr:chymotrypsinogen A-like [Anopheles albimanus]
MIAIRSFGVLIGLSTLSATVVWGLSCRTSSDTIGKCVELKECPYWSQILNRSYVSKSDFNLFNDALEACADADELNPKMLCCAQENIYKKIDRIEPKCLVGGSSATRSDKTSFAVFLFVNDPVHSNMSRCVGSLIDEDYVLTSARCVYQIASENIIAYVNAKYVFNGETGTVSHGVAPSHVESVTIHNEYTPGQLGFDIALLRLKESVEFDSPGSAYPICIPAAKEQHYELENSILHSFGWGANAEGVYSDIRLSVTLQRITLDECVTYGKKLNVKSEVLRESNKTNPICTIGISGHNLFVGYSGAPLMYRKNGAWFQVGVVGEPLDPYTTRSGNKPVRVLSTSVQRNVEWIQRVLEGQGNGEAITGMPDIDMRMEV